MSDAVPDFRGSLEEGERLLDHERGDGNVHVGSSHRRRAYTERTIDSLTDRYDLTGRRRKNALSRTVDCCTSTFAVACVSSIPMI